MAEVRDLVCVRVNVPAVHGAGAIGCQDNAIVDLDGDNDSHHGTPLFNRLMDRDPGSALKTVAADRGRANEPQPD
jgi:hypothetical protein